MKLIQLNILFLICLILHPSTSIPSETKDNLNEESKTISEKGSRYEGPEYRGPYDVDKDERLPKYTYVYIPLVCFTRFFLITWTRRCSNFEF